MDTRAQLVREFATAYGSGGWRGLNIPIPEVRRLAHPDLAPLIRECWNIAANDEVRKLLIEMIWQGAVKSCADLARAVAFDESSTPYRRVVAVRALVACHCSGDVAHVASDVLEQPASWPDRVVHGVAADLFPRFMTAEQLLTLMERTEEPKHTTGFGWVSQQIAEAIEPLSAAAVRLRNGLADLVRSGRFPETGLYDLLGRFDHLVPALATLCGRQLVEQHGRPDAALVSASVIANRFGGDRRGFREGVREPLATMKMQIIASTARRVKGEAGGIGRTDCRHDTHQRHLRRRRRPVRAARVCGTGVRYYETTGTSRKLVLCGPLRY